MKLHKQLLIAVGTTPEGMTVVSGVYRFFETIGLPLGDILFQLWEHNAIPDWIQLMNEMVAAGRPFDRAVEAIASAVGDACYPLEFSAEVCRRLQALRVTASGVGSAESSPGCE